MRLPSSFPPALLLAVAATLLAGCRGGVFERGVRVDSEPSSETAALKKPETRLATAKNAGGNKPSGAAAAESPGAEGAAPASGDDDEQLDQLVQAFQNESPEVRSLARRQAAVAQNLRSGGGARPRGPVSETITDADPETLTAAETPPEGDGAVQPASLEIETGAAPEEPADPAEPSGDAERPGDDAAEDAEGDDAERDNADEDAEMAEQADDAAEPAEGDASVDELLARLVDRIEREPLPEDEVEATRQVVLKRTLYALAGRLDEAVESVDGWETSEQEFLRNEMLALATIVDPEGPPSLARRWSMALPHAREAVSQLGAATSQLAVERVAFITEVESYGQITEVEERRFAAGEMAILYCEIDDFAAERLSDGYETHLQGTWEVFDARGERVFEQVLPADRQTCSRYRRDYFIAYRLYMPRHLGEGEYRLRLTMEDLKGKKYGQSEIDFAISGKQSPASPASR